MSLRELAETRYQQLIGRAQSVEADFRRRAWSEFQRLGLPDRKTETWKYSSLTAFGQVSWQEPDAQGEVLARAVQLRDAYQDRFDVIVVQNGRWRPEASRVSGPHISASENSLSVEVECEDGFSGLSLALAPPGLHLKLGGARSIGRPLMILQVAEGDCVWSKSHHRVSVEQDAHLEVVEIFIGSGRYLRSDVTRVEIGARARVNWLRIQEEASSAAHFGDWRASLAENSQLNLSQVHCGAADWARSSIIADIRGSGAEAHISGLTFARGQQHLDQRIVANHWSAQSSSSQLFKGVLKDRARGIMNGRIFIAPQAQKVASSQLNQNLILSRGAEANTKPELEIYADDVKANHGASVGRLDEDRLFYLESRGIRRHEALQILAKAFVVDVLMKIPSRELQAVAEQWVQNVLPDFARDMEAGA